MNNTNSVRMEYYRHRNEQKNDRYDDEFKGFSKEVQKKRRIPHGRKKEKEPF